MLSFHINRDIEFYFWRGEWNASPIPRVLTFEYAIILWVGRFCEPLLMGVGNFCKHFLMKVGNSLWAFLGEDWQNFMKVFGGGWQLFVRMLSGDLVWSFVNWGCQLYVKKVRQTWRGDKEERSIRKTSVWLHKGTLKSTGNESNKRHMYIDTWRSSFWKGKNKIQKMLAGRRKIEWGDWDSCYEMQEIQTIPRNWYYLECCTWLLSTQHQVVSAMSSIDLLAQ